MSLSPARISTAVRELLRAPQLCRDMWQTISSFGGKLYTEEVKELYLKHQEALGTLLYVYSPEELMQLVDTDDDNALGEDDQLLIFTLIKERLRSTIREFNDSRQYALSKQLTCKADELDQDIQFFQQQLRDRIYQAECSAVEARHRSRQHSLNTSWDIRIAEATQQAEIQLKALSLAHKQQLLSLDRSFNYSQEQRKIKTREELRLLQHKERVAAATADFKQAEYVKRTVGKQAVSDAMQAAHQVRRNLELREKALKRQQIIQLNHATQRVQKRLTSLHLQATSERWRLNRLIDTHLSRLHKQQEQEYMQGIQAGKDELRRTKIRTKEITQSLDDYRKYSASVDRSRLSDSFRHPLSEFKRTAPRFHIRHAAARLERQCNLLPAPRSLAALYSEDLQEYR